MSTADVARPARPGRPLSRGFTLVEAVITTTILAAATLVIQQTVTGVTDTERLMRSIRATSERGQEAAYRLRDVVATSRRLFANDAVGNAYLSKLATGSLPVLPGSRLPTFDEVNPLGPDAEGDPRTGNVLLFVRETDPISCVAKASTKKTRLVNTYRFVCVYLSQTTKTLVYGQAPSLELVEWRSRAFPSYAQVTGITDATEKASVVADLYTRYGFDFLWDFGSAVGSSFYGIDGTGVIASTATAVTSIPEDGNVSSGGRLVDRNLAIARTDMTSKVREPVFSVDDPSVWTPHGFEVKVAGPSGSRKVWMRVTVEQQAALNRVPAQQTTVVAVTRDL